MQLWLYIIIGVVIYILLFVVIQYLGEYFKDKKIKMQDAMGILPVDEDSLYAHFSAKHYIDEEHSWTPTFNLQHMGVRLFNLPFIPEENEIFYLENEYDADANRFVRENISLIRERLSTRGFTFVYLPDIKVDKAKAENMIAYHSPQTIGTDISIPEESLSLPSNFLLDYMIHPENRGNIKSSFAWYGHKHVLFDYKKTWFYYDYIIFDAKEALSDPLGILDDMLPELGTKKRFKQGEYSMQPPPEEDPNTADYNFDEETRNILEEIQQRLDVVRMKGIGEAVIAKYLKPRPVLSHMRITDDFRILLDDYQGLEIKMEPLVKAVYILFLRHENGIAFKELVDYGMELETIYRAIKAKHNDIDERMESKTNTPMLSENVKKLVNPFDNSINEKCTRIKEAFIQHFHESVAENYFIIGGRRHSKRIIIPRNLIIWEDKK